MDHININDFDLYFNSAEDGYRAKVGHVNAVIDYVSQLELSGVSLQSVTYQQLIYLLDSSQLIAGGMYLLTDYQACYDQPDFDYNGNAITQDIYKISDNIEPLLVTALSNNSLDKVVKSPLYPNDYIEYDINYRYTETSEGAAKGRITKRIDDKNNQTDYDSRSIMFKRYKTYFAQNKLPGQITSIQGDIVTGTNTVFTDLLVDDIIYISSSTNPNIYKIVSINSDTEMQISGHNIDIDTTVPVDIFSTDTYSLGGLYLFNDSGYNSIISDGGNDMYDGGNELHTNITEDTIAYTHTVMQIPDNNQANINDFTYDGVVADGSVYFGAGSQYFTNLYPGLFVMSAYDISIAEFFIIGNNGADGSGNTTHSQFTTNVNGVDYTVFVKKVFNAQDPSINHMIIVNSTTGVSQEVSENTDDDYHKVFVGDATQVHYLLMSKAGGVVINSTEINNIVSTYLPLVDPNISNTLDNVNNNFSSITNSISFMGDYLSLNYKQNNIIGDEVLFNQYYTFNNVDSYNNIIGDYSNLYNTELIDNMYFLLSNNIFFDQTVNNIIGTSSNNNTFYSYTANNIINDTCYNNLSYQNFVDNTINKGFGNNILYGNFSENTVDIYFENNKINSNVWGNSIGKYFYNNNVYCYEFSNNIIDTNFNNNKVFNNFITNKIGNNFYNNIIKIEPNNSNQQFLENIITSDCTQNTFTGGIIQNKINAMFTQNIIADQFFFNNIDFGCKGNMIAAYFNNNKIGFGFVGNIVMENCKNNNIASLFTFNDMVEYFQYNTINSAQIDGIDFTINSGNLSNDIISFNNPVSSVDGTYTNITGSLVSGNTGINASFDITVTEGSVSLVVVNNPGKLYHINDTIIILGTSFGGTTADNLVIHVISYPIVPAVSLPFDCNIFKTSNGYNKLSYIDGDGILTVIDVINPPL